MVFTKDCCYFNVLMSLQYVLVSEVIILCGNY